MEADLGGVVQDDFFAGVAEGWVGGDLPGEVGVLVAYGLAEGGDGGGGVEALAFGEFDDGVVLEEGGGAEFGHDAAGVDGGELVFIAEEDEAGVGGDGVEEFGHFGEVDHAGFVHDDDVGGEGVEVVVAEVGGVGDVAEGAIDGGGGWEVHLVAEGGGEAVAQAFVESGGGFAGGGEQADAEGEIGRIEIGELGEEDGGDGGFAGAGSAGDEDELAGESGEDGVLLAGGEGGVAAGEGVGGEGGLDGGGDGGGGKLGEGAEFGGDEVFVVPEAAEV